MTVPRYRVNTREPIQSLSGQPEKNYLANSHCFSCLIALTMFETERLRLRAQEKADFAKVREMWNDREVQRSLSVSHVVPMGPDLEEKLVTWSKDNLFQAIIETKSDNEFVGSISLFEMKIKNRDALLGLALCSKFWGRGYATEALRFVVDYAFSELGLHRVTLNVAASNEGAIKVYKKA